MNILPTNDSQAGPNRHARRAQEAYVKRFAQKPQVMNAQALRMKAREQSEAIDEGIQAVMRTEAPARFWLLNTLKWHWLNNLFGFRIVAVQGSRTYAVMLGGRELGVFTVR